jgi:hypothetical protein
VQEFADAGIRLSARTLREQARKLGACYIVGKTMIMSPHHIDQVFEASQCHSRSTDADGNGGSVDELMESTATSTEALAHLMKTSQKPRPGRSRGKRGNVHSLETTRRSRKTN